MKNGKHGFFVTGTGTGVGKTFVCRLLAETFSKRMPVSYMKPVQTGCVRNRNGKILAPDFEYVKKSNVLVLGDENCHVPYRFVPACSPHCAAKMAGGKIVLKKINDNLNRIAGLFGASSRGCVLVEGAGGVLVPLNVNENMVHLMIRLDLPVILVASSMLGTLNHTFLSLCALQSAGIRIAGVVMNSPEKTADDFIYRDNRETIRSFVKPVAFLEVKHGAGNPKRTMEFCNELVARYF